MDDWNANERPWAFPRWRRRSSRVRPYVARPVEPSPPPTTAAPAAPLPLLLRVRDGLRALGSEPTAATDRPAARTSSVEDLRASLAPLAWKLRWYHPGAWAPPEANEPSPDTVRTLPLPVVAQGVSGR